MLIKTKIKMGRQINSHRNSLLRWQVAVNWIMMVATGMEENKNLGTGWVWRVFRIRRVRSLVLSRFLA